MISKICIKLDTCQNKNATSNRRNVNETGDVEKSVVIITHINKYA